MTKKSETPNNKSKNRPHKKDRGTSESTPFEKAQKHSLMVEVLLGAGFCLLLFIILEVLLRMAAFPPRDVGEDSFVGFSGSRPLFTVNNGIVSTSPGKLRYFNAESFPLEKDSNTFRIFTFGGSTTYGSPFDGRSSFSRWLGDLLNASCPDRKFEVINAGGISYASYRIVPLIRETLQYKPDAMVIYTGHNEFLERRTYSGMFDQGKTVVTFRSYLEELNVYRALHKVLSPMIKLFQKESSGPGKPVLEGEVAAILDHSTGLDLYFRDEEFSRKVVEHFSSNLKRMISLCKMSGIPVVLVDPASNLRDFSPFKSEHSGNLSNAEKRNLQEKLDADIRAIKEGNFEKALKDLDQICAKDPLFAEAHFRRAKALLELNRYPEAENAFIRAKDLDVCPLRSITPIQEQIRKTAIEEKVPYVPFSEELKRRIAGEIPSRIPGNESFLDHVHPTMENNQFVAELIVEKMSEAGIIKISRKLTDGERKSIYQNAVASFDPDFIATKDLNLAKQLRWAGKKQEAKEALDRAAVRLTRNPEIHKMLGSYFLDEGNFDQALSEYSQAVELAGNETEMVFSLAVALARAGRVGEAIDKYSELTARKTTIPDAYANLAVLYLETGNIGQAIKISRDGLQRFPESPALFGPYGLALVMSDKVDEAIKWTSKAAEAEPGDPRHFYNLAGMYALAGKNGDALNSLKLALKKGYSNVEKLRRDKVFDSIRSLPEFQKLIDSSL